MALHPSPPPGGEGFRCMAQNRPGFLLRKPGRFYFTYEVLCVLSQALTQLLAGILNRRLSGCQNCRAFARTYIWYNATISGIVTIHNRVVTTLIALA